MACCESDNSSLASSLSDASTPSSCGGEHCGRGLRRQVSEGNGIMDLFGVQMEVSGLSDSLIVSEFDSYCVIVTYFIMHH